MLRVLGNGKTLVPSLVELSAWQPQQGQQRNASSGVDHYTKLGTGGRSSFNGVVATVFGATGFLGKYVINRLAQNGTMINIPYRGQDMDTRHLRVMGDLGQINFYEYDIRDPESVAKCVAHSNTVINLVGKDFATRNFSLEQCMVDGAGALASASKEAGVDRFIHVSHLMAGGNSQSEFMRTKARGERAVLSHFKDATIMRPCDVIGHEDKYLNKYAYLRKLPFKILPIVGGGYDTIKRPAHVADVAQAIVNACLNPSTAGKTYELYGPEAFYLRDLIEYVFKLIQRPVRIVNVPPPVYQVLGALGERTIWNPKLTRDLAVRQHMTDAIDEAALTFEDLGITNPISLNKAAIEIVRRHRTYYNFNEVADANEPCPTAS